MPGLFLLQMREAPSVGRGETCRDPWAQATGSFLGTVCLRAPAALGSSQSVGLDAFVQAGHSMPEECLVGGMILLGAFVPPILPVRGSEDCKLRVGGPCW